jgi:hypothetical protein
MTVSRRGVRGRPGQALGIEVAGAHGQALADAAVADAPLLDGPSADYPELSLAAP